MTGLIGNVSLAGSQASFTLILPRDGGRKTGIELILEMTGRVFMRL